MTNVTRIRNNSNDLVYSNNNNTLTNYNNSAQNMQTITQMNRKLTNLQPKTILKPETLNRNIPRNVINR